jgi:tetratricopeptide (TPR) repeat protein
MSPIRRALALGVSVMITMAVARPLARQNATPVPQTLLVDELAEWNRLGPYLRIVAAYRAGHVDQAAQDILAWPQRALDEARYAVERLRRRVVLCREATPDIDGRAFAGEIEVADLDAAVLLHTDAAFRALTHGNAFGAQAQLQAAEELFEWTRGRDQDLHDLPSGLRALMSSCHPNASLDSRDWYLAVSWTLLGYWEPMMADGFAELGLDAVPTDAEMLLAAGTIEEGLAIDATQYGIAPSRMQRRLEYSRGSQPRRDAVRSLNEALALYRRALDVRPVFIQTHLRLGRVLSLLDQLDEARAELELAAAGADEAPERYLAELFLARVEEQADDGDAAIAHYRRALAAWPKSQAARIGLVHALGLADGGAGASQQLAALLAVPWPQPMTFDPWWAYPFGEARRGVRLLDELRRRFVVTR